MRIEIDIPKEFEEHFKQDKFEDTLHRLSADAHLIAGNYEQETAIMLIKAFKESKVAYDVEAVVAELENVMKTALDEVKLPIPIFVSKRSLQEFVDICFGEAISIVRGKE